MASLLRSSKFVRYFAGFARNLIFNPPRGETDVSFVQKSHRLTSGLSKSLATQTVQSHPQHDSSLDRSLRRLDQDVRRSGRISRRELEDVLEEIRHARSATSTQSLLIIRCCGNLVPEELPEVRTQLVKEIWKTLENLGVPMDVSHYNALLRVYLENEHSFSPTEFLSDLERKGVEPNRVTYQRLIARYCQEGDIEGATRILEFMREKQLPVNESVFNALIMGHSQADDMESAAGILKVMQQAGLEPSSDTYTTLLCGYAKRGNLDAITQTLEQCDTKDIFLLDKDYMDVIFALAVNNHTEHVDMLVSRLRQMAGYNQDAVNLILRLVNWGQEDVAVKILHTMPRTLRTDGQSVLVGTFLLKQLVKANRPVEKIVQLCVELEQQSLNPRALAIVTETSLQMGNFHQANVLLSAMKKEGHPIRHHYFWPLLTSFGKKGDKEGLLEILKCMVTQFGLTPGGETLRDFVLPYITASGLSSSTADEVINQLRVSGVSMASAACAVVCNLLTSNNLADAAQVASRYRAYYSAMLLRRPLVHAYYHTNDTAAYITMVRQIYEGADRLADFSTGGEEENATMPDRAEMVGQMVLDVAYNFRKGTSAVVRDVLEGLLAQGLGISNSAAVHIQEKLSGELTSEISSLLAKLTGNDLVPLAVTRAAGPSQPSLDANQLKSLIASLEAKGESARGPKKQLLLMFCRSRDLEQAEKIYNELLADDFILTSGTMAQMIELYTHHDKLDEALNHLQQLQCKDPDFTLDETKVIKLALLLVKNDRFQDGLKLVGEQTRERKQEDRSFAYNALCWRLLNTLAEQGNVENVQAMFDALVQQQYIEVNNVVLGPLIKVHIVKDNLSGAMEQFEQCCLKYRSTPWKNELACKLIQTEDAASLQKLTDLSTQVHGEVNSLYDLVFAFVECGRIRQARKILETPGLRSRPLRINSACERYRQEGMVAPLEGLVEATRDLSHIDRCEIYHHLLLSYCKAKDDDKALGLWTRMQEEDVQPTDEFLSVLGKFLETQGKEVPFVIPEVPLVVSSSQPRKPPVTSTTASKQSVSPDVQQFRQSVRQENYDQALDIKTRLGRDQLTVTDVSMLVEGLVKTNRLEEASKLTLTLLEAKIHPLPRIFRFLLNRLATAGDVDTLNSIGKHLLPERKKLLSYDNRLCNANVMAGRGSQYLDVLEKEIDNVKTEDLASVVEKFPRGGAIGILEKHPELISQYERLAHKYANRGITAPINVLWMHLFVTGQDEAANKVWDEFLTKSPRLMFQNVVQAARENADPDMAYKLVNKLKTSSVSEGARGIAHSCLLDVLVNAGKIDEAVTAVDDAVKDVCLENMNRTALLRVQECLKNQGKVFKYEIPEKNTKSSSSSSSSSDDEKPHSKKH